jgi:hypothetical protein
VESSRALLNGLAREEYVVKRKLDLAACRIPS